MIAAKMKAEMGWKIALRRHNGSISYVDLEEWGIIYHPDGHSRMVPLDHFTGQDFTTKDNFICVMSPTQLAAAKIKLDLSGT
jgi:hypothetical protein